jgi:hypothetical protein
MPTEAPKQPWEQRIREAGANLEEDVRRLITYINDEVVPDVRRNSSEALRAAATELQKLAQHMDERNARQTPPPPPPGQPKP